MSLPTEIQAVELGHATCPNDLSGAPYLSKCSKTLVEPEEDEDEDDDVDFNPFIKECLSAEASSSLSSEVDGLDANVDSDGETSPPMDTGLSPKQCDGTKKIAFSASGYTRMIFLTEDSEITCGREIEDKFTRNSKKRKLTTTPDPKIAAIGEKGNGCGSETVVVSNVLEADMNTTSIRNPIIDIDNEDAICRRTRARYSLASCTLDELETFLQESDDEDDFHNANEEEEYRKFLAAVLQGGDGVDPATLDNGNDEDEDNDADFELEIQEALESDPDDCLMMGSKQREEGVGRRPKTRQNKHQKVSTQSKRLPGKQNRPLRPLVPILPNGPIVCAPAIDHRYTMPDTTQFLSLPHDGVINGFMPHQIGQLYCLIHEHVQLLIQVYSVCVLEPSRQPIASEVQGLITDMLEKRNQVFTWRNMPYPSFCFCPPYVHPSVSDATDGQRVVSSNMDRLQDNSCEHSSVNPENSAEHSQRCGWLPSMGDSVLSILDVAPLKLVGRYMDDVSTAVREHQRCYVEASSSVNLIKEPLFPFTSQVKASNLSESNSVPSLSPNQQQPKKTLAATLVENTKKQSVALVPREIAKLAHQFYPLFNPTLFPHKPPPSSVANRVLFTDAEDELLALGLMEYNNDWKAIQQHFLPCKSKHQIFVRQKNRCSAKAPENPIKAVRRMKTSPLNPEEIARIHEGIKVFKLDWMSIWKFIVPSRDPSLLPRQWRIALGTQKSYKMDSTKKEKRRIYEFKRRSRITASGDLQAASEKAKDNQSEIVGGQNDSGEECLDNENGAYVHEAFLAGWRPASSCPVGGETHTPSPSSMCLLEKNSGIQENHEPRADRGQSHEFPLASDVCCEPDSRLVPYGLPESFDGVQNFPLSQSTPRPKYRARRPRSSQLVRLAPDLPPVNLPPSVRVISSTAFRSFQHGSSTGFVPALCSTSCAGMEEAVSGPTTSDKISNSISRLSHDSGPQKNYCINEQHTDTDLQMHPLLFQTPNHGHLPYCQVTGMNSPSSFSFFPTSSHQINLASSRNFCQGGRSIVGSHKSIRTKEGVSESSDLDFHPLLQRSDDHNIRNVVASPPAQVSADMGLRDADAVAQTPCYATGHIDGQPAASTGTPSPKSNANDLNLEFNLSSVPTGVKISSEDQTEVLVLGNNVSGYNRIDVSNDFVPEIVMEQEELSDSDDDEIEDVEFECEEMADSEGHEGSDIEQNANPHDKDKVQPDLPVGSDRHVSESAACEYPDEISAHYKGTSSCTLDLLGARKDSATSPWLRLNSHVPLCMPRDNTAGKNTALSRGERSRKRNSEFAKNISSS